MSSNNSVLVDLGTLRSAYALLNCKNRDIFYVSEFEDSYIPALSALIESLVLFDKVVVPGVPHVSGQLISSFFGDALHYEPILYAHYWKIEEEALRWVSEKLSVEKMSDILDVKFFYHGWQGGCSGGYDINMSYGFDLKAGREELDDDLGGYLARWNEGFEIPSPQDHLEMDFYKKYTSIFIANNGGSANQIDYPVIQGMSVNPENYIKLFWIIVRTRCYEMISRLWGIPYSPHPFRAKAAMLSRSSDACNGNFSNPYMVAIESVMKESRDFIAEELGAGLSTLTYSPVFHYLVSKCKSKSELLPRAYDLRSRSGPRAIRKRLRELNDAVSSGNHKDAITLGAEINRLKNYLRADLGLPTHGEPVTLSFYFVGVPIPQFLSDKILGHAESVVRPQTMFVRDVLGEVSRAAQLGSGFEMLTRGQDVWPGEGMGWSRQEIENHVRYRHQTDLNVGASRIQANKNSLDLVRKLDPKISFPDAWGIVRNLVSINK